jgi:hypothetical protein
MFYAIRKFMRRAYRGAHRFFHIGGFSLKFKGKIAVRGGLRKRTLWVKCGRYSNANFNVDYHYKFKRLWTKGGAVGLKTSLLA